MSCLTNVAVGNLIAICSVPSQSETYSAWDPKNKSIRRLAAGIARRQLDPQSIAMVQRERAGNARL